MSAAEIATRRLPPGSARHTLLFAGNVVGEVFRFRNRRDFGLKIDGVYWVKDQPNTRGGSPVRRVTRLKDAVAIAAEYFKAKA